MHGAQAISEKKYKAKFSSSAAVDLIQELTMQTDWDLGCCQSFAISF